jgi:hypothetical protein
MSLTKRQNVYVVAKRDPYYGLKLMYGGMASNPTDAWRLITDVPGQGHWKKVLQAEGYRAIPVQITTVIRMDKDEVPVKTHGRGRKNMIRSTQGAISAGALKERVIRDELREKRK